MSKELLKVTDRDGLRGIIETWQSRNGKLLVTVQLDNGELGREPFINGRQVLVRVVSGSASGEDVLVPSDTLAVQEDGSYYLPFSLVEIQHQHGMGAYHADDALILPVLQEEMVVHKRKLETGSVSITKLVHEHEEIIDQPLLQEQVDIERVAINRAVEGPIPIRYEGDTLIVSILEEVLVVEKRLILKEELHVTKRKHEMHKPQQVILRSEEVSIKRNSKVRQQGK